MVDREALCLKGRLTHQRVRRLIGMTFACTDHDVILQTLILYTKCKKKLYLPVSGSSGLGRIIVWEDRDDVSVVAEGNYVGSL